MMIKIYDLATRTWRSLSGATHVNEPTWSGDSKFIYYDNEGGPRVLRRVRVADGAVEDLLDLSDYPLAAHWSGLSADGAPMLLRDVGTQHVYALKLGTR